MIAVLWPALLVGLATPIGAIPFLLVREVSRRFYDTLLGFGAGLMLAAATLGLLTSALEEVRPGGVLDRGKLALVLVGFAAGAALLRLMDELIPHEHAGGHHEHVRDLHPHTMQHGEHASLHHAHAAPHDEARPPGRARAATGPHCALDADVIAEERTARAQGLLVVGVMFLHRVPEGLAIGAAWASGQRALGLTLVLAIAVQNAVEGGVMAAPLRRGGLGGGALLSLVAATGLAVPLAAVAGFLLSAWAQAALGPMLALASGALLYLTCNEVIPESHSHGNELRATYGLLAGFVVIMVIQTVFNHHH